MLVEGLGGGKGVAVRICLVLCSLLDKERNLRHEHSSVAARQWRRGGGKEGKEEGEEEEGRDEEAGEEEGEEHVQTQA